MITVYGKDNCRFCKNTLQALMTFNKNYTYKLLGKDYTKAEFLNLVPEGHNTFPAIFEGDTFIGGFSEFKPRIVA